MNVDMSCSSTTACSHLSYPSCSSSSRSSASESFIHHPNIKPSIHCKDVKTMFIDQDACNTLGTYSTNRKFPTSCIYTVTYSSSPVDHCDSFYAAPNSPERTQRSLHYLTVDKGEGDPSGVQASREPNYRRRTLLFLIFPVIIVAIFLAVYQIVIHMQKDAIAANSNLNTKDLRNIIGTHININRNNIKNPSANSPSSSDSTNGIGVASTNGNHKLDRRILEVQFRISNKLYSKQLKNKSSDSYIRLSEFVKEKIKSLINRIQKLELFQLDKVELVSLRKGDNPMYNLNGIIVDLVLYFNLNVSISLNEIASSLISAKRDGRAADLEFEEKTLSIKVRSKDSAVINEKEHERYKWTSWSEWGPPCTNEFGSCDENRVHSRARLCFDKRESKPVDEIYCIKVYHFNHQSLQIEDCICEQEDKCLDDEWKCSNSQCIPLSKRCDGHMNCYDLSDEVDCKCTENEVHCGHNTSCISIDKRCDSFNDCWDNSDEEGCPGYTDES
ncbi:uncharacterized protein LOC141852348 [Brevipalpus obovatus]|uniref:uncharacterized protein LOC141852348 n=1 Tax=Brevipalpus obovatus TaxID=246614 RepID=UPI003D9EEBD1